MIDLQDLQKLVICDKCNCVYMPKYEDSGYYDAYPVNEDFCEKCVKLQDDLEKLQNNKQSKMKNKESKGEK